MFSQCVHNPKGISIGSAVFAGLTIVTDRQRDRSTDRPRYSICNIAESSLRSTVMWPNKCKIFVYMEFCVILSMRSGILRGYKLCKFCENRARDTPRRLYSTFWSNLSKNFSFEGPTPLSLHQWGWNLAWRRGPHRCNVSPLRGEKPQNRHVSKLNTGRIALRAMLPVIR